MALIAAPAWIGASGQTPGDETQEVVSGYVTAANLPTGFDVNGEPVTVSEETSYQWYGGKAKKDPFVPSDTLRVGMYVKASGYEKKHVIAARSVFIRDDADEQLKGSAVVEKVIAAGAEPVLQADGYRIRIASTTKSIFKGNLKSLADLKPNSWIRYAGRRGPDGALVAARAVFSPGEPLKVKAVSGAVAYGIPFRPKGSSTDDETALSIGGERVFGGAVRLGLHWHTISKDRVLQERVSRVGTSLIPTYQKQMAVNNPAKIPFRFYAYDADEVYGVIETPDGLVLIPQQMVERFKNDDQLAAILADAVAFDMERLSAAKNKKRAMELGEVAAVPFTPIIGLPIVVVGSIKANDKLRDEIIERRGRVALALMADAGYDLWAAPEAWRLVTAKKLPANLNTLPYPPLGGYQIHVLSQQYRKTGSPSTVLAAQR